MRDVEACIKTRIYIDAIVVNDVILYVRSAHWMTRRTVCDVDTFIDTFSDRECGDSFALQNIINETSELLIKRTSASQPDQ